MKKLFLACLVSLAGAVSHAQTAPPVQPLVLSSAKVQARSVSTCITDAAPNASCKVLMVWPARFADANYVAACMVMNPSVEGGLYVVDGKDAQTTGIVITVRNSPGNSERTIGTLQCIAFGVLASGPIPAKSAATNSNRNRAENPLASAGGKHR